MSIVCCIFSCRKNHKRCHSLGPVVPWGETCAKMHIKGHEDARGIKGALGSNVSFFHRQHLHPFALQWQMRLQSLCLPSSIAGPMECRSPNWWYPQGSLMAAPHKGQEAAPTKQWHCLGGADPALVVPGPLGPWAQRPKGDF